MADDLVKRLRVPDPCCEEHHTQNEAADRIEQLERERVLDAKLLADTQALLDKAEVVMREAADRIQQLVRERDAAIAALEESGRKRGETLALLDKAVDALRAFKDFDDMPTSHKRPDVFELRVRRKLLSTLAEIEGEKT